MSLKTLVIAHDPEKGCEKCKFYEAGCSMCFWDMRNLRHIYDPDEPSPSWCPFRSAPDKPVTREAILREAAEMMCSVCCWDGAPPQRQERPARWEHADGDTCPSGAIWEQIAKEHGPTTSEAGEKECPS
jgi:hypothetical protein